jgi:hypothetical protein
VPTVDEAIGGGNASPLAAGLRQSERAISQNQEITFRQYNRLVLPLDGFVFWVAAPLITPGVLARAAAFNTFAFNTAPFNASAAAGVVDNTAVVRGSLHLSTTMKQGEETNNADDLITFTSEQEVQFLNKVGLDTLYVATAEGRRYAFSGRSSFYRQAGLWHYTGMAVNPTMATQLVDDPATFAGRGLVISNSLPAWLAINTYAPPYPVLLPFPAVPLYPSFAVPQNLPPPYGAVHIGEEDTDVVAAFPTLGPTASHQQLARDRVRITLFGLNNAAALTFQDAAIAYGTDTEVFGITNMPTVRDVKETQAELLTLAMKKRITFEVSYLQSTMRDVARQLITSCLVASEDILIND